MVTCRNRTHPTGVVLTACFKALIWPNVLIHIYLEINRIISSIQNWVKFVSLGVMRTYPEQCQGPPAQQLCHPQHLPDLFQDTMSSPRHQEWDLHSYFPKILLRWERTSKWIHCLTTWTSALDTGPRKKKLEGSPWQYTSTSRMWVRLHGIDGADSHVTLWNTI